MRKFDVTKPLSLALVLALLMIGTTLVPYFVGLSAKEDHPDSSFALGKLIPESFPGWRMIAHGSTQVINPQSQQLLDKLYSQLLIRTYVSNDGYLIMLSIAYGSEQRGDLALHEPDLCYPAQGFTVTERRRAAIPIGSGKIDVERMEAQKGARVEPITYWVRIGRQNITGASLFGRRLEDLRFALNGNSPDGLLFRVSSIDTRREHAFRLHDQFVKDLLAALNPSGREHLIGSL